MQGWRALAIVPVAAMLWTGPAMAQDDAAEDEVNARLVAPAECVTEPRTVEDLTAILALDGEGVAASVMVEAPPTDKERCELCPPPLGSMEDADAELAWCCGIICTCTSSGAAVTVTLVEE